MNIPKNNDLQHINDTEAKIIATAKQLFIEKGYAETSMSDIAALTGINRPALHYYFRTKDKMFHAVVGDIISSIIPKVYSLLTQKEMPIADRLSGIIDAYYDLFSHTPRLPMFITREVNRDTTMVLNTFMNMHLNDKINLVLRSLTEEMECGKLNKVPIRFILFNFYGLLVTPFIMQDIVKIVLLEDGETFEQMLAKWKPVIVQQMCTLLVPTA